MNYQHDIIIKSNGSSEGTIVWIDGVVQSGIQAIIFSASADDPYVDLSLDMKLLGHIVDKSDESTCIGERGSCGKDKITE